MLLEEHCISNILRFCPDGVYPGSDPIGQSNKRIAEIYVMH